MRQTYRSHKYHSGFSLGFLEELMAIKNIGVLGAGLMGAGIAQVAATSGYEVTIVEISDELIEKGLSGVEKSLAKFVEKGAISAGQKDGALQRLSGTTELEEVAGADIVIEAIVENLQAKRDSYARLDALCKPETIFASNTSSLSITEMMTATGAERRRRFVGMHFFNPVPLMKLVEVIRTILTDDDVYADAVDLAESMGQTVARCGHQTRYRLSMSILQ